MFVLKCVSCSPLKLSPVCDRASQPLVSMGWMLQPHSQGRTSDKLKKERGWLKSVFQVALVLLLFFFSPKERFKCFKENTKREEAADGALLELNRNFQLYIKRKVVAYYCSSNSRIRIRIIWLKVLASEKLIKHHFKPQNTACGDF